MTTRQRPLGTILEILQLLDLDVTYEYEDLIFVSHNLFILKFTDDAACIDLYFNEEIEEEKAQQLMVQLEGAGDLHGMTISYKGAYSIQEDENETLSVEFFDLTK